MKKLSTLSILLILVVKIYARPLQTYNKHSIIIDTDCAIDDMRTISILLSLPNITIEAILVSDGSLSPTNGLEKIKSLLHEFKRESIPTACGDIIKGINPPWREFNEKLSWGRETDFRRNDLSAVDLLLEKLNKTDEKIIVICLGPLTNISQLIKQDAIAISKIERIIWYNESVNPLQGFNYECDMISADAVIESGLRIDVISNLSKAESFFDLSLYVVCQQSETELASILTNVFRQKEAYKKLEQNHFRLCDDLTALYLTNPELFDINVLKYKTNVRYNQNYSVQGIREAICDMVNGTYVSGQNVVFNTFPCQREMFNYDVRQIMDSVIIRYGADEWKAIVMTDEFHGHLGVFSIVGAKMGIKARELFGVGPDLIEVVTYAGTNPPYSCMSDGIQVSTGATLGMGTIHVASDSISKPMAVFTYKNKSIQISLKKEYLEMIKADINEGIVKYGLMDDGYWKLIRRNALNYWLNWDRNKIFDIEFLQ